MLRTYLLNMPATFAAGTAKWYKSSTKPKLARVFPMFPAYSLHESGNTWKAGCMGTARLLNTKWNTRKGAHCKLQIDRTEHNGVLDILSKVVCGTQGERIVGPNVGRIDLE